MKGISKPLVGTTRATVPKAAEEAAVKELLDALHQRIKEKGRLGFLTRHEMLGVLIEEVEEFIHEVRVRQALHSDEFKSELKDIGVCIIWSLASIIADVCEW